MNIIAKICLKESDIAWVNTLDCKGVEIQLMNGSNDFEKAGLLNKPVFSFHIDFFDDAKEESLSLEYNLFNRWKYINHVIEQAVKLNVKGVVFHAREDVLRTGRRTSFLLKLDLLHRLFPNVNIFLENIGCVPHDLREKGNILTAWDVPSYCNMINKELGYAYCYPLLDICHFFEEWSCEVEKIRIYSVNDLFERYESDYTPIHFNYGIGDCRGERHSVTFESNLELLSRMLRCLPDSSNLILEVLEDDYNKRVNETRLFAQIMEKCRI